MKHHFSVIRNHRKFTVHGEELYIEHRPRLKAFDLIYYPNRGRMFGQMQYYDKFICRGYDYTALVAVIIKASEAYALSAEQIRFYEFLKHEASELVMAEALRKAASDTPAHSSKCAN